MKLHTVQQLIEDLATRRPVILSTNLSNGDQRLLYEGDIDASDLLYEAVRDAFATDRSRLVETPDGEIFLNVNNPSLKMVITGAVHISQMLVPIAKLAGFAVTVIDPRGGFATSDRFPDVDLQVEWPDDVLSEIDLDRRTAFVALTHDPKIDDPALKAALNGKCFYVGALGSRRTHRARVERLASEGVDRQNLERISGPIGLDIGARSPTEIAIAIMAEIIHSLRHGLLGRA
jgi:xanthine dehydrogenase accessory factor